MLHRTDEHDKTSHELKAAFKLQLRRSLDRTCSSSLEDGLGFILRERATDTLWMRFAGHTFSTTEGGLVTSLHEIKRGRDR